LISYIYFSEFLLIFYNYMKFQQFSEFKLKRNLLIIPGLGYPKPLTGGVFDQVSCHAGNDRSKNVERPHCHVGLAGGSTPAGRRRRRRRFKAREGAISVPFEPEVDRESNGGGGFSRESPERRRRPTSAAAGSGQLANSSYRTREDAIGSSGDAQDYQERDDEVGEARRGLVRRNLVSPVSEQTSSLASITGISVRFLPWA
jgi:hypothetical protein